MRPSQTTPSPYAVLIVQWSIDNSLQNLETIQANAGVAIVQEHVCGAQTFVCDSFQVAEDTDFSENSFSQHATAEQFHLDDDAPDLSRIISFKIVPPLPRSATAGCAFATNAYLPSGDITTSKVRDRVGGDAGGGDINRRTDDCGRCDLARR